MNVKRITFLLALISAALPVAPAAAQQTAYRGAEATGLALRRLGTTARVLMIGAHPDDENNAALTAIALGTGADVAYLSLTRGDGGQNLIGPELKEGLGLIRSEELLAARQLDGAGQYFGRAYDYGYSKTADEAFSHWPRDSLLADAVFVIRRFRPDVILSVWSGTPRDGHGQHQAAGIIAKAAFDAAADPRMFPGQLVAGLEPHRTAYLYQSSWRGGDDVKVWLQVGEFDPLFGRSWLQISMDSRSRHRSQDQGSEQPPGPSRTGLIPLAGPIPARPITMLDGLDTTLPAIAARTTGSPPALGAALAAFQEAAAEATSTWNPLRPAATIDGLERAVTALERAVEAAAPIAGEAGADLRFRIAVEMRQAAEALHLASGIRLDATASRQRVVPGRDFDLELRLWNGGARPATIESLEPALPPGWVADSRDPAARELRPGELIVRRFTVHVPADAPVSEAYYLREPRDGDLYRWPADPAIRAEPFGPPPIRAAAVVGLDGIGLPLEAEATFVDVDKAIGERRLPLQIVPAVNLLVSPQVTVAPVGVRAEDGLAMNVTVSAAGDAVLAGTLVVRAPAGWSAEPALIDVRLDKPGEAREFEIAVRPPAGVSAGRYPVDVVFEDAAGRSYSRGYTAIDYPHISPHLVFREARTTFSAFPVAVAPGLRVGYIEGAGDDGPAAIARLGVSVRMISREMLESGDFGSFDVIVSGIRAYEVRPDLAAANSRLLDWVRNGGTYIVQYNKQEFAQGGFAPWPVSIPGGDRVTDENSPVRLLDPSHPALSRPNRIGPSDFEGWVQERGLYFLARWDDRYTPLLEMNDPGEPPQRGILLVTPYGRGTWVYTALSLFRELPEGVPGAYRLLANLISLGANPASQPPGPGRLPDSPMPW